MADVSRTMYLSRKLSSVHEESSKHIYDGIFSSPAPTNHAAARIDDYREIFPPSKASLGSSIPILDLPAVDRSVRAANSGFDYAGVFGGFGDIDGFEVPSEKLFGESKRTAKRDAQLPRIPTRRMPSKSQEFSCNYGNDQTSSPVQPRRMPSKSQEFSCNYENDQTSSTAQTRRMPSTSQEFACNYGTDETSAPTQMRRMPPKSQAFSCKNESDQTSSTAQTRKMPSTIPEFACNYGKDETSAPTQMRRMPSKSEEFSCNYGNDLTSTPAQTRQMPSKSQEFPVNYGKDQISSPVQTRRVPSKSEEFSCNYGNDQTSIPVQSRRIPSKSQEFSCDNGNDQTLSPAQTRMQHSKSQEFSSNFSNNQMSASPVQTRKPVSSTSSNDQTSASALPHQAVDSVQHVSVSYHKSNQLSQDGTNGTTHIAHLHAVPGYTLLFDEAGPVKKPGFDKAKRLSMNDADFSDVVGKASRQGKHTRAVSDLGTNQQASDLDCQTRSVSVSNSPQSFGSSGYYKRSSSRRPKSSKKNRERNPFLDEELDVNSAAAISAAAMKRAIEEAEEQMRWAKMFLRELESNGFIKPTLKDSFKVKVTCVTETFGPKQNGSLRVKATRQKKCFDEDKVVKQNGHLNSKASAEIKPKIDPEITSQSQLETETVGMKQKLNVVSAGVGTTMRSPAPETFEEMNADDEMKLAEKSCKLEGGGEWEAAKHLSQLFTGVKNRFVSFMSKQAETEKTAIQKDAPSKYDSLEQTVDSVHQVRNVETDQVRDANLEHTEEKVEMNHSSCSVIGENVHDSVRIKVDMGNSEAKENELNRSGSASSPDIELLTSKQCGASESVEESASRTNDLNLLQEIREQNQEILDGTLEIEHESQMIEEEEEREIPKQACQSQAYDDKVKNREGNEEIVNEMPGLEPVEKKVDESLDNVVGTSRQFDGCELKETEMPKDTQMMQEDVRMVEKTCMVEECYDATSEATEDLVEIVDDVPEHYEHLAANDDTSEQENLFLSKNEEASVPDKINQHEQDVKFSSEEKGRTSESPAAFPFEHKKDVNVGQPQSVQRRSELIGEGICEQTPCSSELSGDESDHDKYLPAVDDILEQDEFLPSSRNEEASVHETVSELDLPSQKESLTEATSTTFQPDVNIEKSKSAQMADELNGERRSEDSGSHSEAADELLEHVNRISEASQEEVAVEEERMTTGGGGTSEFERKEQPSSRQMANELIGEEMTETSMAAGDRSDMDNSEKDIEKAHEVGPCTDSEITECDTVFKFEQKHSDEETKKLATGIGPENQDDESGVSITEANEANSGESSHKRRRWFENRNLPGIFQGERTLENAEGFTVEDRVVGCADEIVNDSDEGVHMEQADACSDKEQEGEGLHSLEGSHRRRRWFENNSEKVHLKPIPLNETAEEMKHDVSSQSDVAKLVNERKDVAEGMGSSNMASDKGECRASPEAGHRRRRWFENGEKSGSTKQDEEIKQEHNETSSSSEEPANTHQSELHRKEREKEKEKLAVERAIREARQRAFFDARDRAAAEARLKAAAAQDRIGKASSEAKPTLSEKVSMDAKLKAERAAVERATYEARERAMLKAMSEKVTYKSRVLDPKNLNSGPSSSSGYSTSVPFTSERPNGASAESPQRRKAISERNKRTMERAAKALEEKNMRDVLVQKEQAERTRYSGVLDAEVKRWSTGKEGNLRSLLSTLQYVLGPDSGWQPIPLTDLVTTTAVRKAYKRAALCVHPDKLQQRRATVQHKYICEKVFDLLKDAWHKFNPDDR